MMRYIFISLWIVGWVCAISLIASVSRDFKSSNNPVIENVTLTNPGISRLEVAPFPNSKYAHNMNFRFEPFADMDEDTMVLNHVRYRIVRATSDSFEVTITKMARGRTMRYADTLANSIRFNVQQADSLLYVDRGIAITPHDKFRNQFVEVTIAVPVGKSIKINRKIGRYNFGNVGPWTDWEDHDWDSEEHGWDFGEEYTMRADGLYTLDGKKAYETNEQRQQRRRHELKDDSNDEDQLDEDGNITVNPGYRYEQTEKKIDSLKQIKNLQIQKVKDSLEKAKEEINKTLQKLEDKNQREEAHQSPQLNMYSSLLDS